MSAKNNSFSYAGVVKRLPFIAFIRTKSEKGGYKYDFPTPEDKERLGFSSFDEILTDVDGCLDIVHWADREKLAQAIAEAEQQDKPSEESFSIVLPSGEKRWLVGSAVPQKQKNGDVVWKGFWMDVTKEKEKDFFNSLILENAREGIVVFDHYGHIVSFSPAFIHILSCSAEELTEKTIFSILPQEASQMLQQHMLLSTLKAKTIIPLILEKESGEKVFIDVDMTQKDSFFVCLFRDVTEFHEKEEKLRYLAYHDPNTGIGNYAYLKDIFPKLLDESKVSQTQTAVLSIALDSVGQLNAISNSAVHAKVITAVAQRIKANLSENDCLAQVEKNRFVVLVTDLAFTMELEAKIDAILKGFNQQIVVDDLEFDLSVSIGVCFCPQDGEDLDELIFHSNLALEKIHADKRSAMRIYSSELSMKAAINLNMRRSLKKAIENEEIKAFFQPQVDIATGQIVGLEALARWFSSDGIIIPPAEFISEAEEYGMIDELTKVILNQACTWNQKWYSMGLCRVPVAVNISGRQFHNETQLLSLVDDALNNSGLPPYLLELELTETSAMLDPENAQRIFQTLLENNIRCALDDFGKGYSSLSVLRSFPLRKIKIDRSFILELSEKKNMEIVRATIVMAHALNLAVLAEGVENRQNFEILKELGCDIIQGYLFSRPLSPEQTELLLMRWDAENVATGELF